MKQKVKKYLKRIHYALFPKSENLLNENIPLDTKNPYIAARREWNFMYGDIIKAKYNWQQIALMLGVANMLLISGVIFISLQSRYIPYAVKIDNLGNSNFGGFLEKQNDLSPMMINAMLRRYVTESRSVIADPVAQKHQLDFVYGTTLGEAKSVLNSFYKTQNPFEIVKNETVDVQINSVLSRSANTWQIHWTEIHRNSSGEVVGQNYFEGLLTVEHHTPSSNDEINSNPLGLYVTHLSWSNQQ